MGFQLALRRTRSGRLSGDRFVVGARGFEPPTSCTPCKRASRSAPRPDCPVERVDYSALGRIKQPLYFTSAPLLESNRSAQASGYTAGQRLANLCPFMFCPAGSPQSAKLTGCAWQSARLSRDVWVAINPGFGRHLQSLLLWLWGAETVE
jgi:hypothetical protein